MGKLFRTDIVTGGKKVHEPTTPIWCFVSWMVLCTVLGAKFGIHHIPPYYINNLFNEPLYQRKVTAFIEKALA